ncbi:diguanylate cyclase (GGDEF)-like protein/PAS domain S-box-containing protein [Granulicella aggregans]|uniref:Diguanylate cyclase (GGDEF)-like protein/PAS domain S-box-containing protein n=1 Tax=Granulicella aggregans TaxID=474949 RepID=A0A7W7ZEL8_9BACT|nr:sensor domain-containing diguanylate cyclase [Granulicella aggregans]MBB5058372.1 diguanylate cyclase (GGDEF)-like protein/PAS domain S-box-containing protein [Granulicella aggregans]
MSIVADMVLTISYFILAAAFLSMYSKSKGLLQIRGIFLIFALFMSISGVTRIMGLLALFRQDLDFSAQAEMISATLAVVSAGIIAALVGRTRDFLATTRRSQQNEARFIAASESSLEAFYTLQSVRGSDGQIIDFEFTYLNTNGEKLIGLPREEIIGQYLCALIPVNRSGGFFDEYKQVVMSGEPIVQEFPMELDDDIPRWIRHEVVRLEDGIAISAADITERKLLEQAAQYRAQHDVLTGLPNRSLLNDRVQQAIDRAIRYKNKVGLFVVDMDMFKEVNDTLGHAAGDLVLVTAAQRLRESVRGTDSVLRIGGDEFIVVMPDVQQEADIRRVAAKVTAAIANGGPEGLENIRMSCSIGIAIYPTQAASSDELFSRADAAMYEAKRRGGGCFEVYSEGTPGFSPQPRPRRRVPGARPALVVPRRPKPTPLFPDA